MARRRLELKNRAFATRGSLLRDPAFTYYSRIAQREAWTGYVNPSKPSLSLRFLRMAHAPR